LARIPPSFDELTQRLEAEILAGRWPVGTKLPGERSLADEYGVSRPVMRELLRRMEERDLIRVAPARGAFVQPLEPTSGQGSMSLFARRGLVTARHLIVARRMLECKAAGLAAENHVATDARQMTGILTALNKVDEADALTASDLDLAFHESIAIAAANPVIQIMFGSIRSLTHVLMVRSLTDRSVRAEALPLHTKILEAILARDAQAATAAMDEHLSVATGHYGVDLDRPIVEVLQSRVGELPPLTAILAELTAASPDMMG
jgi:GntR family transcriptional repressor for pyruvate dehydrogenase complex